MIAIQDKVCSSLDNNDICAVRLFAMDFSKAFDSVSHYLLCEKLKSWPLHPAIINWYISFLHERKQRVVSNGMVCNWKCVNRGTTQGSVSGPYLFSIFLNDLNIGAENADCSLVKYADDSTLLVPITKQKTDKSHQIVQEFFSWAEQNEMSCNSDKCKELVFRKKGNRDSYECIKNIPQCNELPILGVTFQSNCRFDRHMHNKLVKANKSLHILRYLRKESFSQAELDHLFDAIVLPNLTYGLPVYGASKAELTTAQNFLDRCKKRKYTSKPKDIRQILTKQDTRIFNKVKKIENHPLNIPKHQETSYNLRSKHIPRPKVNTERFKNCFINRLIFEHNLAY